MNVKSVAIPNTFFENEEINWIEKYLYCNLMLDADENLIVKMSQKQLGKELGKSENSIRKYINSLVNHGFIEKRLNSEILKIFFRKDCLGGTSLAVQWLDSTLSTVVGLGSVPGQGTETPQAVQCREKK